MNEWVVSALFVTAFLLYQAWEWVRASPRTPSKEEGGVKPVLYHRSLSLLVPAWNAAEHIPFFVESFCRLGMGHKQLILCAGGNDGSYQVARQYECEQIVVLEQLPGMGKQKSLRQSLPYATGDVIFLTDIDCRLKEESLLQLVSGLSESCAVVTGGIRPLQEQEANPIVALQWAIRRYSSPRGISETNGLLGANTAMFRSALNTIGGFETEARSGTDYTLAKELVAHGIKIFYVPDCEIATEFPDTLRIYVHKQARWLRNVLVIGPRFNAWSEIRSVVVTISIPYFYLLLVLVGFIYSVSWCLLILLILHTTLNRVRYVRTMNQSVSLAATVLSVAGDLLASGKAGYQWLTRSHIW